MDGVSTHLNLGKRPAPRCGFAQALAQGLQEEQRACVGPAKVIKCDYRSTSFRGQFFLRGWIWSQITESGQTQHQMKVENAGLVISVSFEGRFQRYQKRRFPSQD